MTNTVDDRLSRITALRPAASAPGARSRLPAQSPPNTQRLMELLNAECRSNGCGEHIVVRRRFSEPRIIQPAPQAMRLLAPGAANELADPRRWLFLDTETTGLAGGTGTYAFLVGIAWWEDEGLTVEQFFMRNHAEEASLLSELSRVLAERRPIVTFNGKSFDWPLLETRYRMTRLGKIENPPAHLDLLHPARQLFRFRLKSVALSELEKHVLALDRGFDIPSETIPGRYFDFLRGGPAEPIVEVFHHNQMDLRGLAALAVHITDLLREPESASCEPAELYGMSRLLQRRGEDQLASLTYERALAGDLPSAAERSAKRELALFAKRRGQFDRANRLWQELAEDENAGPEAYEHLAIYYEHQARDLPRAAGLARQALVRLRNAVDTRRISPGTYRQWHARFQHRLNRLESKLTGKHDIQAFPP
jgi:uncharacterized protein YprB with RNaseH-like and TPR domain